MLRITALLAVLLASTSASSQTVVSLQAGGAEFDLSGTGSAFVLDARALYPLTRVLAVEGGVGVSQAAEQFGNVTYLLPSMELQVGVPVAGAVRPYVGLGLGAFVPLNDPGPFVIAYPGGATLSGDRDPEAEGAVVATVGLDAPVTRRVVVRTAARLRGTVSLDGPDFFGGTFGELTAGLGYRF